MPERAQNVDFRPLRFHLVYHHSIRYAMQYTNTYQTPLLGKPLSSFCLIKKGRVLFRTEEGELTGEAGDFFYMPDGIQYDSHWSGQPDIEFLSTFFRFTGTSDTDFSSPLLSVGHPLDQQIAFQKIPELSGFVALPQMEALMRCGSHSPAEQLSALSILYGFFGQICGSLKARRTPALPSVLEPAIHRLKTQYRLNEPVCVYADLCHLSESRFYHLFRQNLRQTPLEYRNMLRIRHAVYLLTDSPYTVEQIGEMVGFSSDIYFRRVFKQYLNLSPGSFRKAERSRMAASGPFGL